MIELRSWVNTESELSRVESKDMRGVKLSENGARSRGKIFISLLHLSLPENVIVCLPL